MTSTIIPLVYGLLIGKSTNDYNSFFRKILEQDDFHPETILTDFETGTIKSVKEMLPNVTHKGKMKNQ
jgi:MULE transposase domain